MVVDNYDYWLFDLDGTLVDVRESYAREVVYSVGDRIGHGFSDEEVALLWYDLQGSRDQFLRERGIDPGEFWTTFHEIEQPRARAEATYLHDDAAFVADIDQPVGLVTHCQRYLTDPVLDHLDIRDWFDGVVCCSDDLGWKPDPTPVYRAMREIGVPMVATDGGVDPGARGVLAGDNAKDVGAAWNAGLDGIHVERYGHEQRGQCVLGDYRVSSFEELL